MGDDPDLGFLGGLGDEAGEWGEEARVEAGFGLIEGVEASSLIRHGFAAPPSPGGEGQEGLLRRLELNSQACGA